MSDLSSKIESVINGDNTIKDITKKNYISHLKSLFKKLDSEDILDLENPNKIIEFLNKKYEKPATKKTHINAIRKYLNLIKANDEILKQYTDYFKELSEEINTELLNNTTTSDNFITYEELKKVLNKIDKTITKDLADWFLMYLVINYPKRLDYFNLPIEKYDINKEYNYVDYEEKDTLHFYFNEFKNVKTFGKYDFIVKSPEVEFYMNKLNELYDNKVDYLYLNGTKEGIKNFTSKSSLSNRIIDISRYTLGKNITNTMIRKIYTRHIIESENYVNLTNAEKEELHGKLLHKRHTAESSYNIIKKDK